MGTHKETNTSKQQGHNKIVGSYIYIYILFFKIYKHIYIISIIKQNYFLKKRGDWDHCESSRASDPWGTLIATYAASIQPASPQR